MGHEGDMPRRELRIKRPTEENSVPMKRFTQVHGKRSFVLAEETALQIKCPNAQELLISHRVFWQEKTSRQR
jgi:hypothetical protein